MRFRNSVLAALVFASCLSAQVTSRLTGSIVDPSGSAVPAAAVDIFLPGGAKPLLSSVTTGDGLFAFTGVSAGIYDVVVSAPGFRKSTNRGVVLTAGVETSLPVIKLEVGSLTDTVEVTESATIVQTTNAEVASEHEPLADQGSADAEPQSALAGDGDGRSLERARGRQRDQRPAHVVHEHDAGRDQYSGQLHPHERGRFFAEPAPAGSGLGDDDLHLEQQSGVWQRSVAGNLHYSLGDQPLARRALRTEPQQRLRREYLVQRPERREKAVSEFEPVGRQDSADRSRKTSSSSTRISKPSGSTSRSPRRARF